MAEGKLTAKITGTDELLRRLALLDPEQNRRIVAPALRESALAVVRDAAANRIVRGGQSAPRPNILTSRDGALRQSLQSSNALDTTGLRRNFIEAGTDVPYGGVHEFGLTVTIRAHTRTRNGKKHRVKAHSAKFPPRPFLAPALTATAAEREAIFLKHWGQAGEIV